MYRFSFVNSIAGKAQEVSRPLFQHILRRKQVANICQQIAGQMVLFDQASDEAAKAQIQDAIGLLKRQLPAFCWHAWFDGGKRKNAAAHASGLIMLDLDHVKDPRALYNKVSKKALKAGLLAAHITPSTRGLRLVFPVPAGMDLIQAQDYYVQTLKLKNVDACTKDLARLSFCVPEDYWLYVDEESLFGNAECRMQNAECKVQNAECRMQNAECTEQNAECKVQNAECKSSPVVRQASPSDITSSPVVILKGVSEANVLKDLNRLSTSALRPPTMTSGSDVSPTKETSSEVDRLAANNHPTEAMQSWKILRPLSPQDDNGKESRQDDNKEKFEECYNGIPYKLIVESLQELLGGIPAHGSRNNFIFSMAAYLRYVCNDDADWIASILPTYGELAEKWRSTIGSACQRAQYKVMPQIVKRALKNAECKMQNAELEGEESALPPVMPKKLPKLIAHLVKNVPEVCKPAVANAVFPALAAHLKGVKFWLIDGTEKEATFMCVTMAKQSSGKSAVNKPIEYIIADIVERDELNRKREQEWKDATAQKGANKEKPKRPEDLCVQVLVSDMTNAAFVQRMKDANGRYLYTNLEELDLLKQLQTNGTKDVGKIICLCFDNGKYGQERVGTQSVTARVDLRWNWNASTTIQKGLQFFKGRLVDGTLSRINFCTIIPDKSKPFVYGRYDEHFAEVLKPYITNLNLANGHIECKQALELAHRMADRCAEEGALTDDEVYQDMAYRAVTIAYLKSMVLFIANDMTWTKDIAEFTEWSLQYDLWCKSHFFGEQVREEKAKEHIKKTRGRQNLLELLPDSFSMQDAQEVRQLQGLDDSGCRQMIRSWVFRGYIEQDSTLGVYLKTEKYQQRYHPS